MDKFSSLLTQDGIEYLLFKPSLFKLYANCYSPEDRPPYFSRVIHRLRMTREFIFAKYEVVYLKKENQIIGHLVVSRGGTRIAISTKEDIVIGPIWIIPQERGVGIATNAIHMVLHHLGYQYIYAYEFIDSKNLSSIHTVQKNSFQLVQTCKEKGLLKTLILDNNGPYLVYRFDRNQKDI